jgi:spermidine/putrescine transport system ATP-binding protein
VAGFIGNSNFLHGQVAGRHGSEIAVKLSGESVLTIPDNAITTETRDVRIMIRPEEIELAAERGNGARIAIPVTVGERIFLGDTVNYRARTAAGETLSIQQGRSHAAGRLLEVGTQAFAMIAAERCHVFAAA